MAAAVCSDSLGPVFAGVGLLAFAFVNACSRSVLALPAGLLLACEREPIERMVRQAQSILMRVFSTQAALRRVADDPSAEAGREPTG